VNPRDRKEFLAALQSAFGGTELDKDLQAQLLLSHRKIANSVIESFPSNGQRATLWRGAPRPRRKRVKPEEPTDDSWDTEGTFHWRDSPWQASPTSSPCRASPSSSSSAGPSTAWPDPQYIHVSGGWGGGSENAPSWNPCGDPSQGAFLGYAKSHAPMAAPQEALSHHTPGNESMPDVGESMCEDVEQETSDDRVLILINLNHILLSSGDGYRPQENAPTPESTATLPHVRPGAGELIASLLQEPRCLVGLIANSSLSTEAALQLLEKEMPHRCEVRSTPSGGSPKVRTELAWFVQASGEVRLVRLVGAMYIFNRVDASSVIDEEGVWDALRDSDCGSFGRWNTLRLDEDVYQHHEALRRYLHGLLNVHDCLQFLNVHDYLQVAPFEKG